MTRLESALRRAARTLDDLGQRWALVGGLAVSARTEPRFTRDIDLVVAVEGDPDAESLIHALQGHGYRVHAVVEQEAGARLATARLIPVGEDETGVVIDVLFASSGIEPEIVSAADWIEVLPGVRIRVATAGHLIALKLLSRDDRTRPQDRTDLIALSRVARPADFAQVRDALALIYARGFHRRRDLPAEFDQLLRDLGFRQ